jgi:DNA-binding MarR family transcriptional regulator
VENEPSDRRTATWGYAEVGDQLVSALVHELRSRQGAADELEQRAALALGVHRTAARCVELLSRHGSLSAGDLAAGIGLTPSGTTPLLDRLEKVGAIERVRSSAKDRRTVMIELTPKGRAIAREVWDDLYEPLGKLTVDYGRSELTTILAFLRRANAILERDSLLPAGTAAEAASEVTPSESASRTKPAQTRTVAQRPATSPPAAQAPPRPAERPMPPVATRARPVASGAGDVQRPPPPVVEPAAPSGKPRRRFGRSTPPAEQPAEPKVTTPRSRWRPLDHA